MEIKKLELLNKYENEKIFCAACGKRHFSDEKTFFTFYGNVTIGLNGELIGNNFSDNDIFKNITFLCTKGRL